MVRSGRGGDCRVTRNERDRCLELCDEIKRRGLEGKVEVLERDFREVPRQFDKLLSIGTLEHAGRDQLPEVIRAHSNYLKPGGLGVIHFIGHVGRRETDYFIRKYVFPGGYGGQGIVIISADEGVAGRG